MIEVTSINQIKTREGTQMTDHDIVELYLRRSENAIGETAKRYGSYCTKIAMNVLHNREDAEEVVNDTFLNAWNSIPPERPAVFSTFIGRIARNLSLNRYKAAKTQKRGGGDTPVLLSELAGCVPCARTVEDEADAAILGKNIDVFLSQIREEDMIYFVRRYWYGDSVNAIKERFSVSESKVKTSLHRTRTKLKEHLEKEGVMV
jgi:RNA polymerase sigma-70 factor (ECF subfamily)